jgi:hypothetical protein
MLNTNDFQVGDKVLFGRRNGEQTVGTVTKVNAKTLKVRQDESRGSMRSHPIGSIWTVPRSLCRKADDTPTPSPSPSPAPSRPTTPRFTQGWKVGDRVEFTGKRGETVTGTVKRVNAKTVSVDPDNARRPGAYWRVSPGLLRPEGCRKAEAGRPVLVNILTGERTVGRPGEDEEMLYGRLANGLMD